MIIFFINSDNNFYIRYCNIINSIYLFSLHVVLGGFYCIILSLFGSLFRQLCKKCSLRGCIHKYTVKCCL